MKRLDRSEMCMSELMVLRSGVSCGLGVRDFWFWGI